MIMYKEIILVRKEIAVLYDVLLRSSSGSKNNYRTFTEGDILLEEAVSLCRCGVEGVDILYTYIDCILNYLIYIKQASNDDELNSCGSPADNGVYLSVDQFLRVDNPDIKSLYMDHDGCNTFEFLFNKKVADICKSNVYTAHICTNATLFKD